MLSFDTGEFLMTPQKAVAQVFITAFKTLPAQEQKAVLIQMLRIRRWKKDLADIAIAEARSQEKSRPFRDVLADME